MNEAQQTRISVVDRNGIRGTLDVASIPFDGNQSPLVLVQFRDDSQAFIPSEALVEMKEGGYFYPESFDEASVHGQMSEHAQKAHTENVSASEQLVMPIVAEELSVEKRQVERGGVRIVKTVSERVETVDLPLMEEHTEVERVAINRRVESPPPVRYEGDVMIVPLIEEVIVTEKHLMLREELHIRKRRVETRKPQQVVLRREEANIERFGHDSENESP